MLVEASSDLHERGAKPTFSLVKKNYMINNSLQ